MKKTIWFLIATLAPAAAMAQEMQPPVAVAATPPLMVTIVLLLCACACVAFSVQVFLLIKGGQLSRSWLILTFGFVILALTQVVTLMSGFGVFTANRYLIPSLLVVMTGLFIYGLYETKRALS